MTDNICAFVLCCFAITSNLKTTESAGNQIIPIRFFFQVSNEHYVRTLNNCKTFNKHPIRIKRAEQRILSLETCGSFDDYRSKLKSRVKLEKKAKDIKCSFGLIAKSNISYMKDLADKLTTSEEPPSFVYDHHLEIVHRLEEEAKIILHLLLMSDLVTGKWLWMYLLKTFAVSHQYGDNNGRFINPFQDDDHQLETGVSDFIAGCIAEGYLPGKAAESDLVWKKPDVYERLFCDLDESGWAAGVSDGRVLVTTDFLYLRPFWEENQLLFGRITGVNADWTEAQRRFELEVAATSEFVHARAWIHRPYGRLDHQHLLVNIVDARLYCHLTVVLYVYHRLLSVGALGEDMLNRIRYVIYDVFQEALSLTGFKNDFLVVVISEFKFAEITDTGEVRDIVARVRAKADEMLKHLKVGAHDKTDWFGLDDVEDRPTAENNLITLVIREFNDYLNELLRLCLPFDFSVLLHFMDVVELSAAQYV